MKKISKLILFSFRFMPSSIEDKCEEYIEAYTDMIIQLVIKDFTPQQICAELALCPSVEVAPEIVLTKQDTECLFCEFVMRNIDDLMANATTDAQIIDALDQVCNALPTHLQVKNPKSNTVLSKRSKSTTVVQFLKISGKMH